MWLKKILKHKNSAHFFSTAIAALLVLIAVFACLFLYKMLTPITQAGEKINAARVIGLVVTPSEDDWKLEQFEKIKTAVAQHNDELMVLESTRTQASQIEQIRALIVYQVDLIVFSPLVEKGWSHVLSEAEQAGIEIIAVDQAIRIKDFEERCHNVSFDYEQGAAKLIRQLEEDDILEIEILELVGPVNAFTTRELSRGYRKELDSLEIPIRYSYCAESLSSYAEEITGGALVYNDAIGLVLAQNDAMAMGAATALKKHKLESGSHLDGSTILTSVGGGKQITRLYEEGLVDYYLEADNQKLVDEMYEVIQRLSQNTEHDPISILVPMTLHGPAERSSDPLPEVHHDASK